MLRRYRASSCYLPYFASFSGWILLRGYRASSSYLPQNFVRIHAHRLRKYGVSRDYSLSINMDFPTLMLRRHRTSSRYLYHKAVKAMGVHVLQVSYFGQLLFRAIALQTRELADTPNGFEGSSIAAIHSFALVDCRLSRNPIRLSWQLLRDHFGFVGHPLLRLQVEWIGVSIKIVSPLGTKLALF